MEINEFFVGQMICTQTVLTSDQCWFECSNDSDCDCDSECNDYCSCENDCSSDCGCDDFRTTCWRD